MRIQRRLRLVPHPGRTRAWDIERELRAGAAARDRQAATVRLDSGGYGLRVRSAAGATGPSTSSGNSPERVIEHLNRPGPEELRKDILPQGGLLTIGIGLRTGGALVGMIDGDDDIADLLSGLDVPVGLDDLVQPICSVDHRLELSGLDQFPEVPQHLLVMLWNGEHDSLSPLEWSDERQERILG